MSFSLAPSKQVLKNREGFAQLLPEYKTGSFTFVPNLPESLLCLCSNNVLLHLHTNYTEADSILNRKERSPVHADIIPVLPPLEGSKWLTLLDVDPKALGYALLSNTGTLLFFTLQVRLLGCESKYEACHFQSTDLGGLNQLVQGSSLCLRGRRYFLLQSFTKRKRLHILECDIRSLELTEPDNVEEVLQDMLQDYGTENNLLGCKLNVIYHKQEPIATVPPGIRVLTVHGTQCEVFQLLVQNAVGGVEWWRWNGAECEAIVLTALTGVPVGNLLWF